VISGASIGIGTGAIVAGDAHGTGGNPAAWASSPAPSGYRWDFVTFNGAMATRSGEPVVHLVRAA